MDRPISSPLRPDELHRQIPILWMRSRLPVRGPLEPETLAAALRATFARYPILTSVVRDPDEGRRAPPTVEVIADWLPALDVVDLRDLRDPAALAAAEDQWFAAPLDPSGGPPVRAGLARLGPDEHMIWLSQHHLFTDGLSLARFWRDVLTHAVAALGRRAPDLAARGPTFEQHCRALDAYLASEASAPSRAYWTRTLAGAAPIALPLDTPRAMPANFAGDRVELAVPAALCRRLDAVRGAEGAGRFAVVLGALARTLAAVTGQGDLLFVTFHANRVLPTLPGTPDVVGPLAQALPLRVHVDAEQPPRATLRAAQRCLEAALEHGAVPVPYLREVLGLDVPPPRVSVMYQAFVPPDVITAGPLTIHAPEPLGFGPGRASFELELVVWPDGDGLRGVLAYATQVFRRPTVERLAAQLGAALEALADA